jgi:hypothetical protein
VLRHGQLTSPLNMGTWEYLLEKWSHGGMLEEGSSLGQMYLFGEKTPRPSISVIRSVVLYFVLVLRHGQLTSPLNMGTWEYLLEKWSHGGMLEEGSYCITL